MSYKVKTAQRWKHDCESNCLYLGPEENYDLYVHQDAHNMADTVIARWGSEPEEYHSGIAIALAGHWPLHEALKRARDLGLTEK